MPRKKKKKTVEPTSLHDLKESFVEEVEIPVEEVVEELREVVQPKINAPQSFRSLREAKKYAKENGGKVVEKGRFYVR
jgi:hypothetical protein